ncbi:MAG TPA: RdgB/HAM1 family non-canonical purine NTP pyrophosphatase [Gemmatimonadaceae bacterium]|nr:RdgB/HAM1 family non-canonical purine NTP pyrophosphatase [Gemmatimonadaceae bacterium]
MTTESPPRGAPSLPILLATRSEGKLRELRPIFERAGLPVIDLQEAGIAETAAEAEVERFETFEENALAKARYFQRLSGYSVVADDSGLEVEALAGAPGVHSKRWSGRRDLAGQALDDANNERLVRLLARATNRRARYVCVAAYADGTWGVTACGVTEGVVMHVARGAEGFGYDPFFESVELGRTFGEATREEKEEVSHRGRAMRSLIPMIAVIRSGVAAPLAWPV